MSIACLFTHVNLMSREQEIQIELESRIDTIYAGGYEYLITRHVTGFKGKARLSSPSTC